MGACWSNLISWPVKPARKFSSLLKNYAKSKGQAVARGLITSSFQQHVGDYCVLREFCRVPFCVLCSPEVIIVACVLCFSDLSRGDYSGTLHSTMIVCRGDYCGVHHPAHHVTRGIAWPTSRPPTPFLEMFSPRRAMRLWGVFQTQLSFSVRCRGILAGWRITSILPQGKQGKEKLA